jgi:hypothetical protein
VAVCDLDQDPEKEIIPQKPGRRDLGGFKRIEGLIGRTRPTGSFELDQLPFLFLDERTLKDRPRIKAGVIRPPELPSISHRPPQS